MKHRNSLVLAGRRALPAAVLLALPSARAAVSVDGSLSGGEGYVQQVVQTVESSWGASKTLANLSAVQEGGALALFLGASAQGGDSILVFIDSKPGGTNFIPNNLITSGGEENTINSLGTSPTTGLTFEAGFDADFAIRIYGMGTDAHVNLYNLGTGVRSYAGNAGAGTITSGFVNAMEVTWADILFTDYATHANGAEMVLSLAGLGVPTGSQAVKLMAVLVNGSSDYGSNQVLASRTSPTTDIGGGLNAINFETEAGIQTITLAVDNSDNDGDGDPDATDPDDDNDGLDDTVETGTGVYVDENDTGTDPLDKDSDDDTFEDGEEVSGFALGYVSNPNIPNFFEMTVPGTFNQPDAWTPGYGVNDPPTDMTQGDTDSLTGQYQWTLDYLFTDPGAIQYKFAAGSWATAWGGGGAGTVIYNGGGNIAATIDATGIYRFTLDQAALTHGFARLTFASVGEFLAAYGLAAGTDDDNDTLLNEDEFAANTDPTNPDTDGDGLDDNIETGTGTFVDGNDTGTDPLSADTDGDGLDDQVETNTGTYYDPGDAGTNPHLADSDGDGENDGIEVSHGTDPTDDASSSAAFGNPLVDGARDALYGAPLAVQTIDTGFGDNSHEWNAAYARVSNGRLHLLFTGNLGDNYNKLEVFIDSKAGGSSTFTSAGNDSAGAMDGMVFDAGFAPDYHLIARRGNPDSGPVFDLDFADLGAPAFTYHADVLGAGSTGWGATGTGVNATPIVVAYDGSNTAGIGGNTGAAADQVAAAAVTTGLELSIDLADLGNPAGPIKVMLLLNNGDHAYLSNQSLAGLPVGTTNLGNPATIDFSSYAGDQFFTIGLPGGGLRITMVKHLGANKQLQMTISGLEVDGAYKIQQSPNLVLPFADLAGSQFTATAETEVVTVGADPGTTPRNFFRVVAAP